VGPTPSIGHRPSAMSPSEWLYSKCIGSILSRWYIYGVVLVYREGIVLMLSTVFSILAQLAHSPRYCSTSKHIAVIPDVTVSYVRM